MAARDFEDMLQVVIMTHVIEQDILKRSVIVRDPSF